MNRALAHLLGLVGTVQHRLEGGKDRGATAVEYGLLVGLVAVAIIVAVTLLGTRLSTLFTSVATSLPQG